MNKSSSSASSSPPFTTLPPPPVTTSAAASNQRRPPSVIPLDYNYNIMPPSSLSQIGQSTTSNATRSARSQTATSQLDTTFEDGTQYNSLFGDPVPPPPPTEFLESKFDSRASHLFHTTSFDGNGSFEEETPCGRILTSENTRRLFSNVPYTSLLSRRSSNTSVAPVALPRLQPPDIQILQNSSGGSSSGEQQDSPNYALLAPDDAYRRSTLYDINEPADISEFSETFTINDASGTREYSEASRRMSNFNADFKANVGPFNTSSVTDAPTTITNTLGRQFSNESFSSSEWFRPAMHDFPEFSKMPKLRPSSKNVMSIKRDEMLTQDSSVAAMLNDSNGSSSGAEDRLLQTSPTLPEPSGSLDNEAPLRPPEPSSNLLRDLVTSSQLGSPTRRRSSVEQEGELFSPPELSNPTQSSTHMYEETNSLKREMSPVVFRDSIATGSDYRVDGIRLHKKTSFTIISDRTPQSSRVPTPSRPLTSPYPQTPMRTPTAASTPTSTQITMSKPTVKARTHLQRKSLTSTELRMPSLLLQPIPSDDSPRPSVQFDMSRRYSPSKMPQKGILQHRESLSSSQETALPTIQRSNVPPPVPRRRSSKLPAMSPLTQSSTFPYNDQEKMRSYETLPLITDPYRTAIPRLHRSSCDVRESSVFPPGALPRPLKPNPNPTRKQRGLLRILNSAESISRIPLRSNWTASAEELTLDQRRRSSSNLSLQIRRRSSSTSPERRSSTQTASDRRSSNLSSVTTSDFSFRRPSLTGTQPFKERRKSIFPGSKSTPTTPKRRQSVMGARNETRSARTKIAKPTTLSPIIGTPNKDSSTPQSPVRGEADIRTSLLNASETLSDSTSRRGSISKIPIPNIGGSHSNSRLSSLSGSRAQSRSSSPLKELLVQSPIPGRTSRATSSRSPSRSSFRSESRPVSRADSRAMVSRSSSRASTRPISREPTSRGSSRPSSRVDSRPNSRMDQARDGANSRSNSRMSQRSSVGRVPSISPGANRTRSSSTVLRRKSVSLSPVAMRRSGVQRRSISPTGKNRNISSGKSLERRKSQSRIPTRTKSDLSATRAARTSSKSRSSRETQSRTAPTRKRTPSPTRKQPKSAKKATTSVRKPESSVKRSTSSVSKAPTMATKKTPTNLQKTAKNVKPETLAKEKRKTVGSVSNTVVKGKALTKPGMGRQQLLAGNKRNLPEAKELKKQTSSKQLGKSSDPKEATGIKPTTADASSSKRVSNDGPTADTILGASVGTTPADESTVSATATATGALISGMKRQPSTMSLIRMGSRLSLLSRKRPDSSLSRRHITEEVEEATEINAQETDSTGTNHLHKVGSSGQLVTSDGLPAVILEKSQKTLENIQKTVTVATDEIQRKINENLTDLKTLEQDMGRISDGAVSPTASVATVVENRGTKTSDSVKSNDKSPHLTGQPIEASVSVVNKTLGMAADVGGIATERVSASTAISVLPEVDCESANFQNFDLGIESKQNDVSGGTDAAATGVDAIALTDDPSSNSAIDGIAKHRQSPDGQGGSTAGSDGRRTGSRELLDANEEESPRGCCRCCARFCMPCRRSRCSLCCRGKKKSSAHNADESEDRPVLSATSSTTTTNLEVIDEITGKKKTGCWQKLNCFKKKSKSEQDAINEEMSRTTEPMRGTTPPINMGPTMTPKQGKCGACLRKILCCRSSNKIETTSVDDEGRTSGKCSCFPCCRRKTMVTDAANRAWQDPERGITSIDSGEGVTNSTVPPEDGCCRRFWRKIFCCCCRKKQPPVPSGSRRASIKPPPVEDTRRKLHNDLVEYTSKMKGAIPVLPLYLAWFCAICNTVFPGLGTLFSGLFCICVGIPRFSQYDSAKARLGSFIINIIVAAAQLFCVLFCFVGWGWSIWWGTIMLKCAKKLSKIRKVERLEMEEEQRQAAAAAAAARAEAMQGAAAIETTKT